MVDLLAIEFDNVLQRESPFRSEKTLKKSQRSVCQVSDKSY